MKHHKFFVTILALFGCVTFTTAVAAVKSETLLLSNCFINDFAYGGDNILVSGTWNVKESPEECQQSCQAITGCKVFTFFSSNGYCELKFGGGNGLPLPGSISGPRNC